MCFCTLHSNIKVASSDLHTKQRPLAAGFKDIERIDHATIAWSDSAIALKRKRLQVYIIIIITHPSLSLSLSEKSKLTEVDFTGCSATVEHVDARADKNCPSPPPPAGKCHLSVCHSDFQFGSGKHQLQLDELLRLAWPNRT